MKGKHQTRLQAYIRHAERFGPAGVFNTALQDGLTVRQLGQLAVRLRRISDRRTTTGDRRQRTDPPPRGKDRRTRDRRRRDVGHWHLPRGNRGLFALALTQAGVSPAIACHQAGCDKATLSRARTTMFARPPRFDYEPGEAPRARGTFGRLPLIELGQSGADPFLGGDRRMALRALAIVRYGDPGMAQWTAVDLGLEPHPLAGRMPEGGLPPSAIPEVPDEAVGIPDPAENGRSPVAFNGNGTGNPDPARTQHETALRQLIMNTPDALEA